MLPRMSFRALGQPTAVAASVVAMVSLGSCEKVPLLAPTESVITIVSNRSVLPVNGTAEITATVIEQSGTPAHNGTLVTFTSTLGTLDPQEAVTSNGQAVVTPGWDGVRRGHRQCVLRERADRGPGPGHDRCGRGGWGQRQREPGVGSVNRRDGDHSGDRHRSLGQSAAGAARLVLHDRRHPRRLAGAHRHAGHRQYDADHHPHRNRDRDVDRHPDGHGDRDRQLGSDDCSDDDHDATNRGDRDRLQCDDDGG